MTWRLITIGISHYNEKARWALDRFGLEYEEQAWLPVLHFAGTVPVLLPRRLGQTERYSTRFSTPVLVAGDRVITDSSAIMAFAAQATGDPAKSLHWCGEAIDLDRHFSGRFGSDARRVVYWHLLPRDDLLTELAMRGGNPAQTRAFTTFKPLVRSTLRRVLKVDEQHAMRSRDNLLAEFERVGERLADGRRYLLGERFSAADLSFAALASVAMMVQPEEGYGSWVPALEQLPAEFLDLVRQLRETPAGQFVLRMFAEERAYRP